MSPPFLCRWIPNPVAIEKTSSPTQYVCYCGKSARTTTFRRALKLWLIHWEKMHVN